MDEIYRSYSLLDWLKSFFLPNFTRKYLFLASFTFLLFSIANGNLPFFYAWGMIPQFILFLVLFEIGGVLSFYNVVLEKPIEGFTQRMILFFIVGLNIFVASAACFCGAFIYDNGRMVGISPYAFFPLLNIIDIFFFMMLSDVRGVWDNAISDEKTNRNELLAGAAVVVVIYVLGVVVLNLCWPIVFSMCIFYAGHLSGIAQRFLGRR